MADGNKLTIDEIIDQGVLGLDDDHPTAPAKLSEAGA
jgi:hypothetical protein